MYRQSQDFTRGSRPGSHLNNSRSYSSSQERLQDFKNKLEQTFNQPKLRNLESWKGFRNELRGFAATRPRSPPKLSHYSSLKNFESPFSARNRSHASPSRSLAGFDFSSRPTTLTRSRNLSAAGEERKDLQEVLSLNLLRQANAVLEGDVRGLSGAYLSELSKFCSRASRKFKLV